MSTTGPIIIIDDDPEDQSLYITAMQDLAVSNEIKVMNNGEEALAYLLATPDKPFLIICDVKMPKLDGIQLRYEIIKTPELKNKSIPFIFMTGNATKNDIETAFDLSVQGFFTKPDSLEELKDIFRTATHYWSKCVHPLHT